MNVEDGKRTDSPTDWVNDHIRRYVETDGDDGHDFLGFPTLLLTTLGRRSGQWRRTALIYGQHADRLVLVASNAGAQTHPAWFLNLQSNPAAHVQVRDRKFIAVAGVAGAEERTTLWPLMTSIYPLYEEYQTKTDRQIPVVILEASDLTAADLVPRLEW